MEAVRPIDRSRAARLVLAVIAQDTDKAAGIITDATNEDTLGLMLGAMGVFVIEFAAPSYAG